MAYDFPENSQIDFFLLQLSELPFRDQREIMERPFFSLSKRKRLKPIDYVSPDRKITVHVSANTEYGMATIYDLDILIYCASVLIQLRNNGANEVPQTLNISPYEMLKTLKRDVGGRAYELLGNALDRLQSTTVKTNIRSGDLVDTTFSWIDSHSQIRGRDGKIRGMRITLAKWFYDGVLMEGGVLKIDPAYFMLTGGRERWLYRVARKHAGGAGPDGFTISMPTLYEKSGADGDYRRFKFELSRIARENALPQYSLELVPRNEAEPSLRMVRRASEINGKVSKLSAPLPSPRSVPARSVTLEQPVIAFPVSGHIQFTSFGPVAASNLPHPQRDHGIVADEFREFLRRKEIAFNVPNISKIFAGFCVKQRPAN
jgi:plasmid replication initiation protein